MPLFPGPGFIDDERLLPRLSWEKIARLDRAYMTWRESYVAAHDALIARGFEFEDFVQGDAGGDAQLFERSHYFDTPPPRQEHWINYHDEDGWFPKGHAMEFSWFDLLLGEMPLDQFGFGREWQWQALIHSPFLLFNDRTVFAIGMLQRIMVRLWQHQIAKGLENIYFPSLRGCPSGAPGIGS